MPRDASGPEHLCKAKAKPAPAATHELACTTEGCGVLSPPKPHYPAPDFGRAIGQGTHVNLRARAGQFRNLAYQIANRYFLTRGDIDWPLDPFLARRRPHETVHDVRDIIELASLFTFGGLNRVAAQTIDY